MGKAMDFEKLRKKRQRKTAARRLLILMSVGLVLSGAVWLNGYLVDIGFSTRIRDIVESHGGSGYPVPTPGGILRAIKTMDGELAVLNDTNLHLYNQKGKIVSSYQQMKDTTVLVCGNKRAMTYDIGGKRVAVHSRSREMFSDEMEFGILCADMNEQGDFAVATSSRQYVAQITVYDRKFEQIFWWYSSENFIAGLSVSPGGNRMAVGCLNGQGGVIKTVVYVFDFSKEAELQKIEFPDNMLLDISYLPDGRFSVLTDRQYLLFGADGTQEAAYAFGDREIAAMEHSASESLLLLRSQAGRSRAQYLALLDRACEEKAVLPVETKVRDMALGPRYIYILTSDGIRIYDYEFSQKSEFLQPGISDIHLIGQRLYYFTQDEINLMPDS